MSARVSVVHVYHEQRDANLDAMLAALRAVLPDREQRALTDRDALAAALPDVEVLFSPAPPRDGWARASRLRLVHLLGVGADHFLPAPDLPAHVAVAGMRGVFAAEAAEHAIAMMLALVRDLPSFVDDQRARRFVQRAVGRLAGRRLTVLGLGAIGARVVRAAASLDMRVTGVSRTGRMVAGLDRALPIDRLPEASRASDMLVVALPRTPATEGLLDDAALRTLPEGAYVVVLGRGGVVDEGALAAALARGHLAAAAVDVFDVEPLPEDSPLWDAPRILITPHVAGYGERYVERCAEAFAANLARLERGEPLAGLIDRALAY